MTGSGFYVKWSALRREAVVVDELRRNAVSARDRLRAAFDRDGRALGSDQYGAELEKKMPAITEGIFTAFQKHIDELDRIATGLRTGSMTYEQAEHANEIGT
ncbi:hypothetical protein [Microtetraspora sp. NBRC 16547]|uniref:hypothetical protein n=1 Tax=Microtetraspora sp. NBRC 16547 TaxID=3030993 RepID=UPI0024A2274C|nr:hypothetical protein [Microtetraspora sp. NBRC 16547]GLX00105.1 hypothetical protein Misp02_41910 [Microtetraspora sp. NBRC 16547]